MQAAVAGAASRYGPILEQALHLSREFLDGTIAIGRVERGGFVVNGLEFGPA